MWPVFLLGLLALASGSGDYGLGALKTVPPPSLPGHVEGILWQEEPSGPLRFTVDSYVVPNIYGENQKNLWPADLGPDKPRYSLVELEVNHGKGLVAMNGMIVSHIHRIDHGLDQKVARLEGYVDKLASGGYKEKIREFLTREPKGREIRVTQLTWLTSEHLIQVRQARSVSSRKIEVEPRPSGGSRRNLKVWLVPYLTVCYKMQADGKVISKKIVPPGDAVETARRYNPGHSPW